MPQQQERFRAVAMLGVEHCNVRHHIWKIHCSLLFNYLKTLYLMQNKLCVY